MGASQSARAGSSIYDFTVQDNAGKVIDLGIYRGKVLLVVNVASKCGFTDSNYTQLTDLYNKYKDRDFEILAFPCNQFLKQEPGTSQEAKEFACTRYQAEYPIFQKVRVNGADTEPVYKFLKESKSGSFGSRIKWNFTKFLIDRDGKVIDRYSPTTAPLSVEMNLPDRFDMYSMGLIFLQMAFPSLRTDSSLIQFNRQLKRCNYDLDAWRKTVEPRASSDNRKGFELLDLDGGIGWELLTSMVRYKARQRTSAKAALAHPYFKREGLLGLSFMQNLRLQWFRTTQKDYSEAANWVTGLMARSGTDSEGGFTEAQLQELREIEPKKGSAQRNALASILRLQRKFIRTLNESMDEISRQSKSIWWSRWIPREE